MQFMVWVTSDAIKKLSCDRLPASRERLQVGWCNASLYGTEGKIIRMARFCSCSSSADKYAGSTLWNTGHAYSDFDWLKQNSRAARPIRSAIQTWVVTRCQHGISALVSQTSFRGKTGGGVAKCRLFFSQTSFCLLWYIFFLLCSVLSCFVIFLGQNS